MGRSLAALVDSREEMDSLRQRAVKWTQDESRMRGEQRALQKRISELETLLVYSKSEKEEVAKSATRAASTNERVAVLESENKVCDKMIQSYKLTVLTACCLYPGAFGSSGSDGKASGTP